MRRPLKRIISKNFFGEIFLDMILNSKENYFVKGAYLRNNSLIKNILIIKLKNIFPMITNL